MPKPHYEIATYRTQGNLGYLLKCARSLAMDVVEPVLEARGFTFLQYTILAWLRDGIAVNPRDIASLYGHDGGALTRVIDRLMERGLLERVRRDRDRRRVELQLTLQGGEAIDELIPLVGDKFDAVMETFSHSELQTLQQLLTKLAAQLSPAGEASHTR